MKKKKKYPHSFQNTEDFVGFGGIVSFIHVVHNKLNAFLETYRLPWSIWEKLYMQFLFQLILSWTWFWWNLQIQQCLQFLQFIATRFDKNVFWNDGKKLKFWISCYYGKTIIIPMNAEKMHYESHWRRMLTISLGSFVGWLFIIVKPEIGLYGLHE